MKKFKLIKPEKRFEWKRPKGKKMPLKDVKEPNLFRKMYPYTEVPRVTFDRKGVPMDPPEEIWITCTTFRDGQQARPPYTVDQVVDLFTFLHRLGGPKGVIRQSEFFLYSDKDKEAVRRCLEKGFKYPEVTGWIRATASDFKLVKEMGLKETGILTSASDYHTFLKLKGNRKKAFQSYLDLVKAAIDSGIKPRCHLEDITRADIYGFIIPFAQELMELSKKRKVPIKIRLCDTMGFGVPYPEAALPRSVPKLVSAMVHEAGVPKECLEWHGHNDFHKVLANGVAGWLYGTAALNGTFLGIGERTGNPPIEGACIEYVSLMGTTNGMDLSVITEVARYYKKEIGFHIPRNYPFVGDDFNVTRAGIHADGVIKNEEIYNIFDTGKILNRGIGITITDKSGVAGVALWVNKFLGLKREESIPKNHPGVIAINKWVAEQYKDSRSAGISSEEMLEKAKKHLPEYFVSDLDQIKDNANRLARSFITQMLEDEGIISLDPSRTESVMEQVAKENPFIQLLYVVDLSGKKVTKNITQVEYKQEFETKLLDEDFSNRRWFIKPMGDGNIHVSNLYMSKVTDNLCITVSAPIKDRTQKIVGILGIDMKFEHLAKLEL